LAHQRLVQLRLHSLSRILQAKSPLGFPKTDPQLNHFGWFLSLKSSVKKWSTFFEISNFTETKKYFLLFFRNEVLYQNCIKPLSTTKIIFSSKLYKLASKKISFTSSQKHPAFQATAQPTVPGSELHGFKFKFP
jgi:hypothetical protein